jgi:hypothetical protein
VRHAVNGIRSFWLDLEAQKRALAGSSCLPIESWFLADELAADSGGRGYIIAAPSYTSVSAGIRCLYRLCDELNRCGYRAFVAGSTETAPDLSAPLIPWEMAIALCRHGFIAVYPETVAGNPLRARSIARWVLNRPGLLGGETVYGDSEMVFYYSDVFLPYVQNRVAGKLYMPTIDEEIFFCDEVPVRDRSLESYYLGKSAWKDGVVDKNRTFEITRTAPRKEELGKLFRASRCLYCFDNSTILIYEALMCGCPVVVIPDGTQTKEDYRRLELGMDGIAWGLEELPGLKADVPKLRQRYDRVKREFPGQLDDFIKITQASPLANGQRRQRAA